MKSLAALQIIEQLKDTSHPPIVLLDGSWGIGKTYLIENEIKQIIESDKEYFGDFHYLTAYGMRSVTDFQDQVVSLFLSKQKESSDYISTGVSQVSNLARIFGANNSEANLVQGVLSGLTGIVRQRVLQNLSNMTIILDDLERLTDSKVISDILGMCLRFSEFNKIKIIVVANSDVISDKSKVEKTFSDIVLLSRDSDELIEIISKIYHKAFEPAIEKVLRRTLNKFKELDLEVNNIRVFKRAMNRIIKLKDKVDVIDNIDLDITNDIISSQIFGICFLSYCKGYSEKDFVNFLDNKGSFFIKKHPDIFNKRNAGNVEADLSKEELEIDSRNKLIESVLKNNFNQSILKYCFTNVIPYDDDDDLIRELGLPLKNTPLDLLVSGIFYDLSEDDFNNGVSQLENFIFKNENKCYYKWIDYCNIYIYLINNEYVKKDKDDILERMKDILSNNEFIELSNENGKNFRRRLNIPDEFNTPEFDSLLKVYFDKLEEQKDSKFRTLFYNNWQEAIYNGDNDYQHESFLNKLDVGEFCEKICEWKGSDIIEFRYFIQSRYTISGVSTRYQEDLDFIRKLLPKLKNKQKSIHDKLKSGILYELTKELELALKKFM
ncbi:P-loop NTPase fold protein [Photobacterium damselae]|uniref:P-loop NTPase fold protein n=1 Tax=Photobacterium damselae TaxID=38293 RepID=UPI0040695694